MKDYINRLARGSFDYEPPVMYLSENHIEEDVVKGEDTIRTLVINSMDDRMVKGILYSSNELVSIDNPVFRGVNNTITYRVNTKGLERGSVIEGRFDIVCDGGEQSVYYVFKTKELEIQSSIGRIHNLFHFANLVQSEPENAKKIFLSKEFVPVVIRDNRQLQNIYELLCAGKNINRSIEEFLIQTNKKTPVVFGISATERLYEDVAEDTKDSVVLAKSTWGYADIHVSCDNPCITMQTTHIESDMFAGNKYEFSYVIELSKCHKGNNYARICFQSTEQYLELLLTIHTGQVCSQDRRQTRKELFDLVQAYVDFRLKRLNIMQWLKKSTASIEKIRSVDDNKILYKLLHAQLLLVGRKREEAGWLIEYAGARIRPDDKNSDILYAYYLYLCCLYRQDKAHARESLAKIRKMYEEGSSRWQILWIIMYMDEDYEKNKSLKLASIKEQYYKGCKSPIMYLEALQVFNEQPVLLRVFDEFELQVINFGLKKDTISPKLAMHIGELAEIKRSSSLYFTELLKRIYLKNGEQKILKVICKNLIRNEELGSGSFKWYELAVNEDVRLTNLYEYYMLSCDKQVPKRLPKVLLLYFAYNNTLGYALKAFLYASVISARHEDDQSYETYRGQMENYVIDQIIREHINDNLALVYREVLEPSMVKRDMAEGLLHILFTRRIICRDKSMIKVYVKHKEYDEPQCYGLTDQKAFIQIYTDDAVIVFEDRDGNRYVQTIDYSIEKLFDESDYIRRILEFIPDNMWLRLYISERSSKYELSWQENLDNMKKIILDDQINDSARLHYVKEIIQYYYSEYDGYELASEYIDIDAALLDSELRRMVIETYMVNGCFDKAMEIIRKYGFEECSPRRVLRTCSYLLEQKESDFDEELLQLCSYAFFRHKYDRDVLNYLVQHFNGGTRAMQEVWKAAGDFEIERNSLDERLLTQMMFVHSYSAVFEQIFEDYYNSGARERIVEAYIGYNAYNYFVKDTIISNDVFRVIEHRLQHDEEVLEVAKLALLLFYSGVELGDAEKPLAQHILDEMCSREIVFGFYKKFINKLTLPFNVRCITVVEYAANPDTHVLIHYIHSGAGGGQGYMVEEMRVLYDGIFVKNFILFYGESVQYYITEERNGIVRHTESRNLICEEINADVSQGRYEMINDILASEALNDDATFEKLLYGYAVADHVAKNTFKPL